MGPRLSNYRLVPAEYGAGVSVHELAQDYGVPCTDIRDWLIQALRERLRKDAPVETIEAEEECLR